MVFDNETAKIMSNLGNIERQLKDAVPVPGSIDPEIRENVELYLAASAQFLYLAQKTIVAFVDKGTDEPEEIH